MPELPEVEFTRRQLQAWVVGQTLEDVQLGTHTLKTDESVCSSLLSLRGRRLSTIERRGKYLFLKFSGQWVCVHLAMTGKWIRAENQGGRARFARFVLSFEHQRVVFLDTRKLGKLFLLPDSNWQDWAVKKGIGPDVYDDTLTAECLSRQFNSTRRSIKSVLLDQKVLCGAGNIYVCEALYLAGVSPIRPACDLTVFEVQGVLDGLRQSMHESLAREQGEEIEYLTEGKVNNPFMIYKRAGELCSKCKQTIVRLTQQGRGTFYCPSCQN
ncbi:MAG: bifunctional DNA-formamidopyrimidine glycosylase/DNA-(apurinic or apyrimidinic site) lyase [Bradymonadia bacterium]